MKTKKNLLWLGILIVASVWIIASHNRHVPYRTASGFIFGTLYNITYQGNDDLKQAIENELKLFDSSLSTFNKSSVISKINRNEEILNLRNDGLCLLFVYKKTKKSLSKKLLRGINKDTKN